MNIVDRVLNDVKESNYFSKTSLIRNRDWVTIILYKYQERGKPPLTESGQDCVFAALRLEGDRLEWKIEVSDYKDACASRSFSRRADIQRFSL